MKHPSHVLQCNYKLVPGLWHLQVRDNLLSLLSLWLIPPFQEECATMEGVKVGSVLPR